ASPRDSRETFRSSRPSSRSRGRTPRARACSARGSPSVAHRSPPFAAHGFAAARNIGFAPRHAPPHKWTWATSRLPSTRRASRPRATRRARPRVLPYGLPRFRGRFFSHACVPEQELSRARLHWRGSTTQHLLVMPRNSLREVALIRTCRSFATGHSSTRPHDASPTLVMSDSASSCALLPARRECTKQARAPCAGALHWCATGRSRHETLSSAARVSCFCSQLRGTRARALVPPSRHGTCIAKLAAAVLEVSWPSMPACNSNDKFNEPDLASGIGSALRDRSHGE